MSKTVDSLAERLTKVEKSLTAVEHQLSLLIEKLSTDHQKFNAISRFGLENKFLKSF